MWVGDWRMRTDLMLLLETINLVKKLLAQDELMGFVRLLDWGSRAENHEECLEGRGSCGLDST